MCGLIELEPKSEFLDSLEIMVTSKIFQTRKFDSFTHDRDAIALHA